MLLWCSLSCHLQSILHGGFWFVPNHVNACLLWINQCDNLALVFINHSFFSFVQIDFVSRTHLKFVNIVPSWKVYIFFPWGSYGTHFEYDFHYKIKNLLTFFLGYQLKNLRCMNKGVNVYKFYVFYLDLINVVKLSIE
jgi:hypothetical protein